MKDLKIGIIRGLQPREAQAEFSRSFRKLKPVFLSDKELGTKNLYLFDPVKLLLGKTTHQSWVGVEQKKLETASRKLNFLETYELYHFFSGQTASVAKKLHIPLITEVWTSFAAHPAYFLPPYSWNAHRVIKATKLFIARSYRAKKALIDLGIPTNKIKVIYNGVNLNLFRPRKRVGKRKKVIFLFVGEMEKYKGVEVLANAFGKIHKINKKTELWLVGKGSLKITNPGIKNFGYVKYNKLASIYRQADVFVSPSINRYIGPFLWWEEFFSYTLMEAQASGLAVIASDSGGIPEELGDSNFIVKQNSELDLVKAMEKMTENTNLMLKTGRKNRRRSEKLFDLQKQTAKLESVILERISA